MAFKETIEFSKNDFSRGVKKTIKEQLPDANALENYLKDHGLNNLAKYLLKSYNKELSGKDFGIFCNLVSRAVNELNQEYARNSADSQQGNLSAGVSTEDMIKGAKKLAEEEKKRTGVDFEEFNQK